MKAIIFDMDGLLIDTEGPSKIAWQKGAELFGFEIDDQTHLGLIGRHIGECLDILSAKFERDLRKTDFMERVDDIYFANFMRNGIGVRPGALHLLEWLSQRGVPKAVATSSQLAIAPRKLRLAQLEHFFPLIVSGCEVEKSKPAPDIFLLTAKRLGIQPKDCLVLEDSYHGIRGAAAAGMTPIMIPDQLPANEEMEQLTRGIYATLTDAIEPISEFLNIK